MQRLSGVRFLFDAKGKRTAVVIDLKRNSSVWEDLYDAMIVERRKGEPRVSWKDVKRRLQRKQFRRAQL